METCGYIMSNYDDYETLIIRCSQCSKDTAIDSWQEFIQHFVKMHKSKDIENFCEIEQVTVDESYLDKEKHILVLERETQQEAKPCELITISDSSASEDEKGAQEETMESESEPEWTGEEQDEKEEIKKKKKSADKFIPSFYREDARFLKLVEFYKKQPCLWNMKHEEYRNSTACKAAYQTLIAQLKGIEITYTVDDLEAALKQLHFRLRAFGKRIENGALKKNTEMYNNFMSCSFLHPGNDPIVSFYKVGSIELDFSTKNNFATDFVQLYANYPELYDHNNKNYSSMECRRQAYTMMKESISDPNSEICYDDIYLGVQSLRQWYYRNRKQLAETGNESEKFYLKACHFLAPYRLTQQFNCEICGLKTFSDNVLQLHKFRVHNVGDMPFKCSQCDRNFASRNEVATHKMRVHIGKVHNCPHCDRAFAVFSDLRVHIRTHIGTKILCELCGKAFRLRSQLTLHMTAVHTKIRAYKCKMCPKDFLKRVHLTDHIKSHLNIRDKICSTCGKGFSSCNALIRHRQIHSEIKKFACKLCDARFKQFVGLNSHMKRTHKIAKNNAQKATETVTELIIEEGPSISYASSNGGEGSN